MPRRSKRSQMDVEVLIPTDSFSPPSLLTDIVRSATNTDVRTLGAGEDGTNKEQHNWLHLHVVTALAAEDTHHPAQEVAVTHLPHVFVAVVPEIQLVVCYDFVASAVVVVWICAEKSIR